MNDHAVSIKPLFASLVGFATGLAGNFSVDTFTKLCTSGAALVAIAYSLWKWSAERADRNRRLAREEAALAERVSGTRDGK